MQKVEAAVSRFVRKGAAQIEQDLKISMSEPKSGHEYKRKKKVHVASAPGESPGVDSSNLIGSPSVQSVVSAIPDKGIRTVIENSLEAKIGTAVEYALYLEAGTATIAPRPLWEKTATEVLPTLETLLANEIRAI